MECAYLKIPHVCLLGAPPSEGRRADLNNCLVDVALVRNPVSGYRHTAQRTRFTACSTIGFANPKGS
jgi:hypothetical protein